MRDLNVLFLDFIVLFPDLNVRMLGPRNKLTLEHFVGHIVSIVYIIYWEKCVGQKKISIVRPIYLKL